MKKIIKQRYELTDKETEIILEFLKGNKSSRDVGKILGCSHQGVINLVCSICRQWVQEGYLKFKK